MADIAVASGHQLDNIGNLWGLTRYWVEDDSQFRKRIMEEMRRGPGELKSGISPLNSTLHNCECGAHKLGYTDRGLGHSHWCPMAL